MLNRKQMEDVRTTIARNTGVYGGAILVYENGRFEIHNLLESEISRAKAYLSRCENVSLLSVSHRLDFSHIDYLGRPRTKYTITGVWKVE